MSTVLIVDDNHALAENLAEILEDDGHDAVCVTSPSEALVVAGTRTFDVVVLDVRMPGMDGVALHGIMRPKMPGTAFVMMTAFAKDDRIGVARAAGIAEILEKPFAPASLVAAVSRARSAA